MSDEVNSPKHYDHPSGIQPIEITQFESFLRGNIIKYVMRAPYKNNELQDLKKAEFYLRMEIDRILEERSYIEEFDAARDDSMAALRKLRNEWDEPSFDDLVWPEKCQECDGTCKVCDG